ncbi:MAG: NAD(P)-dependent oxidoreductase [Bacteroidales bacterium]|nr:NAD(P)-dependent oxidoreductase [Bacteroidales bacterium]
MKILVTGASGFIGGEVVEHLATNPDLTIIATGRSFTSRFEGFSNVEYLQIDFTKQIPSLECEVCIHCAGLADDRASEEEFIKNNVLATERLIGSMKDCQKFIFISSSSVYDFSDGKPKKEEDAYLYEELSPYGKSKLIAEKIVAASGISSVFILRPRAVYGTNDRVLLPRIFRLLKGKTFVVPGDLKVITSLTHISNLLEAVRKTIYDQRKGLLIYNIADKETYILRSVFEKIGMLKTGRKVKFLTVPIASVKTLIILKKKLGLKTSISIQSLNYLTQNSAIVSRKASKELGLDVAFDFHKDFSL